MIDEIRSLYQKNHKKAGNQKGLDYLNGRVFETLEIFFQKILGKPFKGRMLDLGCGDGSFARYSNEKGLATIGIDINDGINFEKDWLPFRDGSFDIVFMYSVIEHINDPSNILAEIKRVLVNGGTLVLITPNFDQVPRIFYDDPTHVKPYNPRSLSYLMRIFGFREDFIGLWTVKKSPLIWKMSKHLQFLYGRVLPFSGTNCYAPTFLRGKSTSLLAAFSFKK